MLVIIYTISISPIVRWCLVYGLLIVYVKFNIGISASVLNMCSANFDVISGCVSAFICSVYRVFNKAVY